MTRREASILRAGSQVSFRNGAMKAALSLAIIAGILPFGRIIFPLHAAATGDGLSQKDSDNCAKKVKALEEHAASPEPRKKKATRITETELNSYFLLELKSKFHPCLRSIQFTLLDNKLRGTAALDFDKLGLRSTNVLARMLTRLFSGVHSLSVAGKLVAAGGKARFELDEARFDGSALPNLLVEEIISAVGKKQRPPFDPLQPSQMPYAIDRVEVRSGHLVIHQ